MNHTVALPTTAPTLPLQVRHYRHIAIVSLAGLLDAWAAQSLLENLEMQRTAGYLHLVADLRRLEGLTSQGAQALLQAMRQARQHGGDLRLADLQPAVQQTLALYGVTRVMQVYTNAVAAVASLLQEDMADWRGNN